MAMPKSPLLRKPAAPKETLCKEKHKHIAPTGTGLKAASASCFSHNKQNKQTGEEEKEKEEKKQSFLND